MKDLFLDLNEEQQSIVKCIDGPVVVFAGAGTGKTRVITYRIAYLLSKGVRPENIIAMTFTNKAADEMRSRVLKLASDKAKMVWISTFHSFAAAFLRKEADNIGLDKNFCIYDEQDQKQLLKECYKDLKIDEKEVNIENVREQINRAKDNFIDCESYKFNTLIMEEPLREITSKIYMLYQKKLLSANAFDFGDLLMKTVEVLKNNSEIREKYNEKYHYINIDEYQDVNYVQATLAKTLALKYNNIFVVGDDDQAIYSWRGANVNYLLNFKRDYCNAKEFKLERNYRSSKIILEVGNALISNNYKRSKKYLWTQNTDYSLDDVKIISFENEYEEAKQISSEIKKIRNRDSSQTIAVFYRTNAQSRVFEEVFQFENIPYKIIGSLGFYARAEIRDMLAYLRVLTNSEDTFALKRIINVPARGIGETTIDFLENLAKQKNTSLWQELARVDEMDLSTRVKNSIWKFLNLYDMLKKHKDLMLPSEFIKLLVDKIGYIEMLQENYQYLANEKIANIEELVSAARNYEISEDVQNIEEFLSKVSLLSRSDITIEKGNVNKSDTNFVNLMTLHAAKGLEFENVFITGLEERVFPVWWAMASGSLDIEEERRLCYVGITRAKKKLFFTYSQTRRLWGIETSLQPSRFIKEIFDFYENITSKKQLEEQSKEEKSIEDCYSEKNYRYGEYVFHKKFGIGKVINLFIEPSGDKVEVLFNDGVRRKLHLSYAKLKKIKKFN